MLLYGRIAPIPTPETQDTNSDDTGSLSDEQQETLRQKYIARMKLYESEAKAEIEKLNLPMWSPDSTAELRTQEKRAIEAFGSNQFGAALIQLDGLLEKISGLRSIQQEKFLSALEGARQAFTEGNFEQASSAVNDALRYKPENQEAQLLKGRVASMETVSQLVREADVARVENNLVKEIELLDKAIKHDPHHTGLVERHRQLIAQHRQQIFDTLLQQAHQDLDSRDVKQARGRLMEIKKIDTKHPSLILLSNKLKQLEKELTYQNLIEKAKAAEQEDSWQAAESHYQQAQLIFPSREDSDNRLRRAAKINQYIQMIEQALLRPERLADNQIASAMQQIVEESVNQAEHSIKLQQIAIRLKNTIAEMSKPVAVTIYSDGHTHISVLGVGVIGRATEYKLKEGLKPGRYLFKGERRGFKDKLLEVYIKPDRPVIIRVICDESIF